MRLHERTQKVQLAYAEIEMAFMKAVESADLTPAETFILLARIIQHYGTYEIRMERHGTYEKKADEV